jgi:hypothetical protein
VQPFALRLDQPPSAHHPWLCVSTSCLTPTTLGFASRPAAQPTQNRPPETQTRRWDQSEPGRRRRKPEGGTSPNPAAGDANPEVGRVRNPAA